MINFLPVILGGDVGAYALAREFNDAYGVKPILVTAYNPLPIRDTAIARRHYCPGAAEEKPLVNDLASLGQQLKQEDPSRTLILMANTEWRIQVLARNRQKLETWYQIPIPSLETIEKLNDKESFENLAHQVGIDTPLSFYQDFSTSDQPDWKPQPLPQELTFPLVAKPAQSAEYEQLMFEGRKKVYRISSQEELEHLWSTLRKAGFRGKFIAQQLIEGDDTQMYSITAYVNKKGSVSFMASARVLLEEHHPATLGNPCAMITTPISHILQPAKRLLESVDYHGFANFDVKQDPHSGRFYFLEVNPRIGRNSFYCLGAGINPMKEMTDDLLQVSQEADQGQSPIQSSDGQTRVASGEILYCLIPHRLLKKYIQDPALLNQVNSLIRSHRTVDPLINPKDRSFKRRLYHWESGISHYRKFHAYYPKPTATGF